MAEMIYLRKPVIISYPKSGRTWLRMILAHILKLKGKWAENREIFFCRHWTVEEANPMPKKIIYLKRDIRDTLVSHYFEKTKRMRKHFFEGTLSEFIKSDEYGVKNILEHRRGWGGAPMQSVFNLSYEGLQRDAAGVVYELLRLNDFETDYETVKHAVRRSQFDRMKKMEVKGKSPISGYRGRFGYGHKEDDPESFRCRRGVVGGYKDYLSEDDLKFIKYVEEKYAS